MERVETKRLKGIPGERGRRMEILRGDDAIFSKFGQVDMTATYSQVVKAGYAHQFQDGVTAVSSIIKLVLHNDQEGSPTRGEINEFFGGIHYPLLVKIPRGVMHGWKGISETEAMIVNVVTEPYNYGHPGGIRVDPHENDIPYRWGRRDR